MTLKEKIDEEEQLAIDCEDHITKLLSQGHLNSYEESLWVRSAEKHRQVANWLKDYQRLLNDMS